MTRSLALTAAVAALLAGAPTAASAPVVDGSARFEVITPSLVRVEIAEDGRFEDGRTLTTAGRRNREPAFTTSVEGDHRIIRTDWMTLRFRRGSTSIGPDTLIVDAGRRTL